MLRPEGSGAIPDGVGPVSMSGGVLTIGRGDENDMTLPDPERHVSKRHCVVEDRGGDFFLIDLSTNGTFLNYSPERIGDQPTPLNDGDVINLGRYELRVMIGEGVRSRAGDALDDLPPPMEQTSISSAAPGRHRHDPNESLDDPLGETGDDDLLGLLDSPPTPGGATAGRSFIPEDALGDGAEGDPMADPLSGDGDPFVAEEKDPLGPPPSGEDDWLSPRGDDRRGTSEHFRPKPIAKREGGPLIPDDFDDDPFGAAEPPPAAGNAPRAAAPQRPMIPEDDDLDGLAPPAEDPAPAVPPRRSSGPQIPEDDNLDDLDGLAPPPARRGAEPAAPGLPEDPLGPLDATAQPGRSWPDDDTEQTPQPAEHRPRETTAQRFPQAPARPSGSPPARRPAAGTPPRASTPDTSRPAPQAERQTPAPAAVAQAPRAGGIDPATRAFLEAAGAEPDKIPPEELEAVMTNLGGAFRVMVDGLREVLMTRTQIKEEFRLKQTQVQRGRNNPLKFSVSAEHALEMMVRPGMKGFLPAQEAAAEALRDIRAHELATISGMEAALKSVLGRLDPKMLAGRLESGSSLGGFLGGKKARYWEIYEKLYGEIAQEAEDDFHKLFGEEFARAYEDQLKKI